MNSLRKNAFAWFLFVVGLLFMPDGPWWRELAAILLFAASFMRMRL